MGEVVGSSQGKHAQRTPCRQTGSVGGGKHLVDRAITAASDNTVDFGSASLGNCFSHQTRRVSRFPGDPHLYNVAIIAQRANSRSYTRLTSRLAVQNNPYMCPASLPLFSIADQAVFSIFRRHSSPLR